MSAPPAAITPVLTLSARRGRLRVPGSARGLEDDVADAAAAGVAAGSVGAALACFARGRLPTMTGTGARAGAFAAVILAGLAGLAGVVLGLGGGNVCRGSRLVEALAACGAELPSAILRENPDILRSLPYKHVSCVG